MAIQKKKMFKLIKKSNKSQARLGKLKTTKGVIETPFFMPIGTKGSVKSLDYQDIKNLDSQIILSNAYHLYLQPGLKILKKFKGLHNFMNWNGPILTDSGGYQVFSLNNMRIIKNNGVEFRSIIDGSKHLFTPEKVQKIQDIIGSDIKMVLDVCSPYPCSKKQAEKDMHLTHLWAKQSLEYHQNKKPARRSPVGLLGAKVGRCNLLFGIIQGSTFKDLRLKSVKFLSNLNFNGLAIGGLAVGESNKKLYQVLDWIMPEMPKNKPRYLMGVGKPENIVQAVKQGIDMFDCVIPTREARHGRLYLFKNDNLSSSNFYKIINISNSKYKNSTQPINNTNLKDYSLGYLAHLFKAGEPLSMRLATLNNLDFYLRLMKKIREQIKAGKF